MPRPKMTADHINDFLAEMTYSSIFQHVPLDLVTEVLKKHNSCSSRCRKMPAESIVYLLIMLGMCPDVSIVETLRKLLYPIRCKLDVSSLDIPVKSSIVKARKRLNPNIFKELFDLICKPQANKDISSCYFKDFLMVAVDGSAQSLQNTEENINFFGYSKNQNGDAYNPKVRITALMECGTKMFFSVNHGSYNVSENQLFREMLGDLTKDMLLFADRNFFGFDLWNECSKHCGAMIWRVAKNVHFPIKEKLSDGSFISELEPSRKAMKLNPELSGEKIKVRIVEFRPIFEDNTKGELVRLVTTILDCKIASSKEIAMIYPSRWLIEEGFSEIKSVINKKDKILRGNLSEFVLQELYSFFISHYIIRLIMCKSAEINNLQPNEISFKASFNIVKDAMIFFPSSN